MVVNASSPGAGEAETAPGSLGTGIMGNTVEASQKLKTELSYDQVIRYISPLLILLLLRHNAR